MSISALTAISFYAVNMQYFYTLATTAATIHVCFMQCMQQGRCGGIAWQVRHLFTCAQVVCAAGAVRRRSVAGEAANLANICRA